jgi:ATP-dependent helicase/nuclease subunit B
MGSDGTDDDLHAAYINLAERTCKTTPQTNVLAARDAVLQGITVDVQRIHAGHTMPALGEGSACDYCAARGLCRKDMWTL